MEAKKNPIYNLDTYRTLFFNIGLVISMGAVIGIFETKQYEHKGLIELAATTENVEEIIDIPITEQPPPPPPKVQVNEVMEVPNETIIEDELEIELDIEINEETRIAPVQEVIFEEAPEEEVTDEIFMIVEERPEPAGGLGTFYQYIAENMKYPRFALQNQVQGKVFVQFVVEKDGKLSQISVIKGIGYGCDEAAIEVLEGAPAWKPGKQRGNPVRVRMMIPITFKLATL